MAAEFGRPGGIGEKLQTLLEKRAEEKDSWVRMCFICDIEQYVLHTCSTCTVIIFGVSFQLFEWWNEVAYLGFRSPVVVHSSPGIGFPLFPVKDIDGVLRFVAETN